MAEVWIVVDGADFASPTATNGTANGLEQMISALKQAILTDSASTFASTETPPDSTIAIQVVTTEQLNLPESNFLGDRSKALICPLTLNLPPSLAFAEAALYRTCQDVAGLRDRVEQTLPFKAGAGNFWLPIVLTVKGPLYAEVITRSQSTPFPDPSTESHIYTQPLHLSDALRQPLYQLAHQLLKSLAATPAVYLMQFGIQESADAGQTVCFDRLFPFPAVPSIASLGVQMPDLFTCHWRCITGQPILDLIIRATDYQVFT